MHINFYFFLFLYWLESLMLLLSRIRTRLTRSTIENNTSLSTIERRYVFTDAIRTFLTDICQWNEETSKRSDPCLFFGNISRTKTVLLRSIPNQTTIDWLVAECETRGKPPSEFEEIICDQCAYMHVSTTNVPSSSLLAVRKFIFSNILVSQDHSSHSTHWNGRIPISLSFFGLVWEIFPKNRQGSLIHTKKNIFHVAFRVIQS